LTRVYNLANQLTSWNGAAVTSDLNGNLNAHSGLTYAYNARNELTSVKQGNTTLAAFVHDALGRRVRRTVSGAVTRPVYDRWNVVQERSSNGQVTANLLVGLKLDDLFVRTDAAQREFLSDALGSTVALADTSGVVQTSYTYEPFGRTTVSGASSSNAYQFTGRDNDSTGTLSLYNMRSRYFSPTLGRFLTEDPIGFSGGDANLYGYVGQSPASRIDSLGLDGRDCGFLGWRCVWDALSNFHNHKSWQFSVCVVVCASFGHDPNYGWQGSMGCCGFGGAAVTWSDPQPPHLPRSYGTFSGGACFWVCSGFDAPIDENGLVSWEQTQGSWGVGTPGLWLGPFWHG
jgi:RHS repeat-associated protein